MSYPLSIVFSRTVGPAVQGREFIAPGAKSHTPTDKVRALIRWFSPSVTCRWHIRRPFIVLGKKTLYCLKLSLLLWLLALIGMLDVGRTLFGFLLSIAFEPA